MALTTKKDNCSGTKTVHVFVRLLNGKTAVLRFPSAGSSVHVVKKLVYGITKIPIHLQRLIFSSKLLNDYSEIRTDCTIHLLLPLIGGKGGFGSLLRGTATKAGQKKVSNFDACRDMSGRRLRHVNAEKRLEEWKAGEGERRLEKIAEEFIKKKAKSGKKWSGDGEVEKYVQQYREVSSKCVAEVEDAMREASRRLNENGKRMLKPAPKQELDAKRLKIWLGKRKLDDSEGSDVESTDSDETDEKSVVFNNGSAENSDSVNNELVTRESSGDSLPGSCSGEEIETHKLSIEHQDAVASKPSITYMETTGSSGVEETEVNQAASGLHTHSSSESGSEIREDGGSGHRNMSSAEMHPQKTESCS